VRIGFRTWLLLSAVVPTLVVAGSLWLYLDARIQEDIEAEAGASLKSLMGIAEQGMAHLDMEDTSLLQDTVEQIGRASRVRVTLIREDGVVLADSDVAVDRVPALDNHGGRPEIDQAITRGTGRATRFSNTLGAQLKYLAHRVNREDSAIIVRLAYPMTELEQRRSDRRNAVLWIALVALILAGVGTWLLASRLGARVSRLRDAALRMASGEFEVRVEDRGSSELSDLADSMNRLALACQETFHHLEQEGRLVKAILEGMQEGVLAVSPEGRITSANPAMLRLAGFDGDPVDRYPAELLRTPGLLDALEEAGSGKPVTTEVAVIHPERLTLLVNATPLGGPGGVLVVVHDITEVHRLHRMRRDFVANVSHELRNPIATIQAAVETLSDVGGLLDPGILEEDRKTLFATIERQTARMSTLVNDLLDLSRIESGQLRLKPEEIDLRDFVEGIVRGFDDRARARRFKVEMRAAGDLPELFCDRTGLQTVLTNLLDNAVKYTREGDDIEIRIDRGEDSNVVIEVEDSGPGVDAKHLPRLFERFYRVDKGRSRDLGGTGLGLAIVKHLCAAMGGSVSVRSTVGKGTTFRLVLPVRGRPGPGSLTGPP